MTILRDANGVPLNNAINPAWTFQVVSYDTSTATTNAITSKYVMVVASTLCHVAFAASPTATTSSIAVPAGTYMIFKVPVPGTSKAAFIKNASAGVADVIEMGN